MGSDEVPCKGDGRDREIGGGAMKLYAKTAGYDENNTSHIEVVLYMLLSVSSREYTAKPWSAYAM